MTRDGPFVRMDFKGLVRRTGNNNVPDKFGPFQNVREWSPINIGIQNAIPKSSEKIVNHVLFILLCISKYFFMDRKKYMDDLKEIKDTMDRATRFISLSGLSGVSTGISALIGALFAYWTVFKSNEYLVYNAVEISGENLWHLFLIATGTLILSIGSAIFFTNRKTKMQNQRVWGIQVKRLLFNLAIPLISGGLLCLMFLLKGFVGFIFPLTLIFYGLALINGSKYTLTEIRNLGILEILLGLIAFQFIGYGLLFWILGFGILQIIYGIMVQKKY